MIGREDFSTAMDDCVTRWPSLKGQLEVYYKSLNALPLKAFADICSKFVEGSRSMPLPRDFKEEYEVWRQGNRTADVDGATYRIRTGVTCKTCMDENSFAISEPLGEPYQCRGCYTGLTAAQIKARFGQLIKIIGAAGPKPFDQQYYDEDGDRVPY